MLCIRAANSTIGGADGNLLKTHHEEQQPLKHELPLTNCTLKTRLGLGNWKYGRCTTAGRDCPKGILKKNRDQIESLIASILNGCFPGAG